VCKWSFANSNAVTDWEVLLEIIGAVDQKMMIWKTLMHHCPYEYVPASAIMDTIAVTAMPQNNGITVLFLIQ
jgi:hypothetical protein